MDLKAFLYPNSSVNNESPANENHRVYFLLVQRDAAAMIDSNHRHRNAAFSNGWKKKWRSWGSRVGLQSQSTMLSNVIFSYKCITYASSKTSYDKTRATIYKIATIPKHSLSGYSCNDVVGSKHWNDCKTGCFKVSGNYLNYPILIKHSRHLANFILKLVLLSDSHFLETCLGAAAALQYNVGKNKEVVRVRKDYWLATCCMFLSLFVPEPKVSEPPPLLPASASLEPPHKLKHRSSRLYSQESSVKVGAQ